MGVILEVEAPVKRMGIVGLLEHKLQAHLPNKGS